MKIQVSGIMDTETWFYKNCKTQRRRKSKCCDSCPFRAGIEKAEKEKRK
jgi:hypothetical protein